MELTTLLEKLRMDHLDAQLDAVCQQAAAGEAVEAGYSVLFLTLETLMTRLARAKHENRLERALQQLAYPKVLVLDEIGYLPLSREEASLFFRLIVRRYERPAWSSPATRASWTGARCSTTMSWPRLSLTGCSITPRR